MGAVFCFPYFLGLLALSLVSAMVSRAQGAFSIATPWPVGLHVASHTHGEAHYPTDKLGPAPSGAAAPHFLFVAAACGLGLLRQRRRLRRCAVQQAQGGEAAAAGLAPCDQWIAKLDLPAFGKEVHELGRRLKAEQGREDQAHLEKMVLWSRICAAVGLATMWLTPNPLTVLALSLWTHSAWTMMGHHVSHGGYNRTDDSGTYNSRGFAQGSLWQRVVDWFDWMLPEAWNVEHNQLHHYRLGEDADPDLLERNAESWTGSDRYTMPFLSMLLWKWAYYAPNTYKELKLADMRKNGQPLPAGFDPLAPLTVSDLLAGKGKGIFSFGELLSRVIGPYFILRFFVLPLPLALLGGLPFYTNAVCNLFLADIVSNIHGYVVIVTNHAGNDLYRFQRGCKPKSPTFYLRAITSSANFRTGGDVNDFLHGWLNYQIEHHCWPDLSMLAYQRGQPELWAICERHGVPYVQEDVFVRLKKTLDIAMGKTNMRRYPKEMESEEDMMVWSNERVRELAA
uniref:Fatty acid desaturase domain-containing protein n=1 Tax=Pyrodinium bahamense TaxID=73915 RepID=A0A7S0FKY3_9DINO|mmetsp:Transcript_36023/g.99898  ORF Transcript_36023/g.99898 Transcript_36023/m.99898 type:complete len:509 (+) Transcript_36023:53-1579(+)